MLVVGDGLATEEDAAAFLEAQGDAWIRAYLYGKSPDQILSVYEENEGPGVSEYGPIEDGVVLPMGGQLNLVDGNFNFNRVPILLGANRDEMKYFYYPLFDMTELQFNVLMSVYGDAKEQVLELYPREAYTPATPYNQFVDIQDVTLELLCSEYAALLIAPYQDTWLYHFRYDDLVAPYDYVFGAAHGLELPFVFGAMDGALYPEENRADRDALSLQTMSYWSCFAATGDPDCGGTETWPTFQIDGENPYQRQVLDTPRSVEPLPELSFDRINFWLDYYDSPLPPVSYDAALIDPLEPWTSSGG